MIEYDDHKLQELFAELEPKRRLQAIKGGFRREANRVRKTAIKHLRGSLRSKPGLEKGIRALVFKRTAGFRVTIGTKRAGKNGKGEAGFHTNRQGLKKPVLIWAEEGTAARRTKPKQGTRRRANRMRKGHSTGAMPRFGFMAKTLAESSDAVTQSLRDQIRESVKKVSEKYGCK